MKKRCLGVRYIVEHRSTWSKTVTLRWIAKFEKKNGEKFFAKIIERETPREWDEFGIRTQILTELRNRLEGKIFEVWHWKSRMYCRPL